MQVSSGPKRPSRGGTDVRWASGATEPNRETAPAAGQRGGGVRECCALCHVRQRQCRAVQTRFELVLSDAYGEDKRAVACLRRTEAMGTRFQQVTVVRAHLHETL